MLSSTFESCHLSWHSERNFIPRLINLSSTGIGPILVWRRKNTHLCKKSVFFFRDPKRKLVDTDVFARFDNTDLTSFRDPRIMKQIKKKKKKPAVVLSGCEACSSITPRSASESNRLRTSTTHRLTSGASPSDGPRVSRVGKQSVRDGRQSACAPRCWEAEEEIIESSVPNGARGSDCVDRACASVSFYHPYQSRHRPRLMKQRKQSVVNIFTTDQTDAEHNTLLDVQGLNRKNKLTYVLTGFSITDTGVTSRPSNQTLSLFVVCQTQQ